MLLKNKLPLLLMVILIGLGIYLRIYKAQTYPGGFFIDEVNMAVDAKSLAQNGVDQYGRHFPFVFEDATDYKLPGYIYAVALTYKFFGPQLLTVRLPSLLSSIASIFTLGYLAYLLFPKRKYVAYYTMLVISLSIFAIHFARIGYETVMATFFLILYLIALIKTIQGKNFLLWYIVGILSMIISLWTYPAPRFIIPAFTILLLSLGFFIPFEGIKKKPLLICSGVFLLISALAFIPSFINGTVDKRPLSYLLEDAHGSVWDAMWSKLSSIISSSFRNFNLEFLFDKGSLFAYRHGTKENGVFLPIFILPFVTGIYLLIKQFSIKNFSLVFIVLLTIVTGFPSALTSSVPYMTRLVPFLIPLCIIIALGIDGIANFLSRKNHWIQVLTTTLLTIVLVYQLILFSRNYFVYFPHQMLPEFPAAPKALALYVSRYEQQHPSSLVYFLNDKTCHNWGEDALHLWYFANLPNKPMIEWNNLFRQKRFSNKQFSPFDALDMVSPPTFTAGSIVLFPGYVKTETLPTGTLFVRCGYQLPHINESAETISKVFYMYEDSHMDPFYVVSMKK